MKPLFWLVPLLVGSQALAGETLKISAAVSSMNRVFTTVSNPFEKETGVKLVFIQDDPKGVGSDVTFKDVDQGRAEAGAAGTHWEGVQDMLRDLKYTPVHKITEFKNRVIARDRIRIFTFKGGPSSLTEEQIRGLFRGRIKNWKEVGGPDQEVLYLHAEKLPATETYLAERFLKFKNGLSDIQARTQTVSAKVEILDYIRKVGSTPGAFGIGPDFDHSEANKPEMPEFARPITFFWIGAPSPNVLKFLRFMEGEGKKYVPH